MAGWDEKKTLKALTEKDEVELALRERPFCRTVTTQKDSFNHIGFLVRGRRSPPGSPPRVLGLASARWLAKYLNNAVVV